MLKHTSNKGQNRKEEPQEAGTVLLTSNIAARCSLPVMTVTTTLSVRNVHGPLSIEEDILALAGLHPDLSLAEKGIFDWAV